MKKIIFIFWGFVFISVSVCGQYYEADTIIKLNQNLVEKLIINSEIYFCKMDTVFKSKDQIKLIKTVDLKIDYFIFDELYFEYQDGQITYLEIFTKSGKNCIYSREFEKDIVSLDFFEEFIKNISFEQKLIDYDLSDVFEESSVIYLQIDTARNGSQIVDFQKSIILKIDNQNFRSASIITKPNPKISNDQILSITLVSRDYKVFELEGDELPFKELEKIMKWVNPVAFFKQQDFLIIRKY